MSLVCYSQVLGYSPVSAAQACSNYTNGNTSTYYCEVYLDYNSSSNVNVQINNDNLCSEVAEGGYYSNGTIVRYFDGSQTLGPASNCIISPSSPPQNNNTIFVQYCCDDRIFYIDNIANFFPGGKPVGTVVDILVADDFGVEFQGCFRFVQSPGYEVNKLSVVSIVSVYGITKCEACLSKTTSVCVLPSGTYTFVNCSDDNDQVSFEVSISGIFKYGNTVLFGGKCYYLKETTSEPAIFSFSQKYGDSCASPACTLTPTPTPSIGNSSKYVRTCCGSVLYEFKSGIKRSVGNIYSVGPSQFCYTVVSTPINPPNNVPLLDDTYPLTLVNSCSAANCQPCPSGLPVTVKRGGNECEPVTLFPLGVECSTINPTVENPFSGVLSLTITGGTSPYFVSISPGFENYTNQMYFSGLRSGTYFVTVTDFYRDFTATTTCSLAPAIASPTPTPTLTPTPSAINWGSLCYTLNIQGRAEDSVLQQGLLTFSGYSNNKPQYRNLVGNTISWNNSGYWELTNIVGVTNNIRSYVTDLKPLTGWNVYGNGSQNATISVNNNTCPPAQALSVVVQKSNPTCSNRSDGSIILQPNGGQPPYSFSTNNVTFTTSPLFSNLAPGYYTYYIKDSLGTTVTSNTTLAAIPQTNNQILVLDVGYFVNQVGNVFTYTLYYQIRINPTLSLPDTVTMDLDIQYNKTYINPGSVVFTTSNNTIEIDNNTSGLTPTNNTSFTLANLGNCGGSIQGTFNDTDTYGITGLTINSNQTIDGTSIFTMDAKALGQFNLGCLTKGEITITITPKFKSSTCACCVVTSTNLVKTEKINYLSQIITQTNTN